MTIPQRYKIMIMSEENIGFIDVKLQSTAIAAIAIQPKITHKAISCFDAYGTLNFLFLLDIKFPFNVVLTKYHLIILIIALLKIIVKYTPIYDKITKNEFWSSMSAIAKNKMM